MKRIIITILIGIILIFLTIFNIAKNNSTENKKTQITVAEVTHSIFYAPWYVAIEKDYFEDLEIEVILTSGANNVIAAVLSGDAEIGFCGPEGSIYAYKNNNQDTIMSFASLTKRDGQFLVLRNNIRYQDFKDIENLTILAGRSGGMPLLNFEQALDNENITNVNIDTSVEFANLTSAFIAGSGDGVNLFEPNASLLVKNGYGYIATNIGAYSGQMPYTAFNAKKSYIENNKDVITKFYNGIKKGLQFVKENDALTIAKTIQDQFPDTTLEDLTKMVDNYKKYDSWYETPIIPENDFKNLEDIMIKNNELDNYVPFNDLVYELN